MDIFYLCLNGALVDSFTSLQQRQFHTVITLNGIKENKNLFGKQIL